MKVAAIYDVHGNLPALEAVLGEVEQEGVDLIVIGGDVLPGPMPAEALDVLFALATPVRFIYGNGERDLLSLHRGEGMPRVPEPFHDVMRWVLDRLPPDDVGRIAEWPATTVIAIDGLGDVLFCHATPRDDNEIFTRVTPEARLRPIFDATGAAVAVCGHTHMQFDRKVGDVRVVNAGSVGMPFGEPGAYWALLGPGVELRRTPYDCEGANRRAAEAGFPDVARYDAARPPAEADMLARFEEAALGGA